MNRFIVLLSILAVGLAGCGGGGGGGGATNSVALTGAPGNATAVVKTAAQLPKDPGGTAFVSAAQVAPVSAVFGSPATLTFTLTSTVAAGKTPVLLFYDAGSTTWTNWIQQGNAVVITVSADRLTVTVSNVLGFPDSGYFALVTN